MKRLSIFVLGLALLAAAGCGDTTKESAEVAMEPAPLLDRELFFGDPEISGSQLSPDGKWMSFIKPYEGTRNIWVKAADAPFDSAKPVTADDRPVPGYFWSRDSAYILYVQDKDGDENYHVWAVDPAGEAADKGVPAARNLTPVDGVRAQIYSVPKNVPEVMLVGMNDRDPRFHDIYKVDIASGERVLIRQNDEGVGYWMFDLEGELRLAYRQLPDGGTELLRVDMQGLEQIITCTYEEDITPVGFHKDRRHVYIQTNKGERDLSEFMMMDVETGELTFIEKDPENEVDFGNPIFHPDTDELMATTYVGDRVRVYPKTKEAEKLWASLQKALPEGEIGVSSMARDMSKMLVSVSSDVDPGSVYLFDTATGKAELQYRSRPELPAGDLAHMKPVSFSARDGMKIHGYLTVPKGMEAKNLPVVMYIHGGPWARDYWGYDPYAQFLANRGYAVMQVNYRSSTGYGKNYMNAGNREWGIGSMQHDISDAVQWLKDEGIADPARVGIFGGSYGGYATLAGVTFTPDLYACGVPYVGPSNLITLIDSFPEYWKPFLEGSWYKKVGNPEIEADRQDLIARSPLFHCEQIKAPLLVVHGANDPRVKQHESDQIVVALRQKDKPVEYVVAPDEGHGFRAPNNRKALAVAMERFLAKHLHGRVQEDVLPETQARLDEITVDVKAVEVTTPDEG
ncbi:MAG: S9 family peptidase [Acidobacteria bacterium]|uniref:S9 family peptidase n=1 Tax=Candidatus Polarisedimenticola svalbardensis TaxID=2886004 RepID=A0A8J6Y328_9BACT|nr:S9 family peptidase [Candidatus Polarisedimenticola svalbardensis]